MEWCSKITVKSNVSQECVEYENFNCDVGIRICFNGMFFLNQDAGGAIWRRIHISHQVIN